MGASEQIRTEIPETANALAEESAKLLASAETFTVETDAQYELAGTELKVIANKEREIEQMRKDLKAPILEAGKTIDAFFKKPLDRLTQAKATYKRALLDYQDKKERARREEEARIREEQRKEAERLAAEAEAAEKSGDKETANALIEQAATMPEAIVVDAAPKVSGVATRSRWVPEAVGTDDEAHMELLRAIVAGRVPLIASGGPNWTFLRQQATSLKSAMNIPGFRAVEQKGIAA